MHSYEYVSGVHKPLKNQMIEVKKSGKINISERVECNLAFVDCLWYGQHHGGCHENGYFETGRSFYCNEPSDSQLVNYDWPCNSDLRGYVSWHLIHIEEYYDCIVYEDPPPTPDPVVDCAGVQGGTAYFISGCGCVGGNTGLSPCVDFDPCAELKTQNQNTDYKSKVNELHGKTNLKKETGYAETKSGTFNTLTPGTSSVNSDNLKININTETVGFTHTHLDDYELENTMNNGMIETRKPIKMFSPADVDALMKLVQANNGSGDFSDYYITMVSSNGDYTIKFTGSNFDIKTGFDTPEWKNKYLDFYRKENGSDEKKFLKFLEEKMHVYGVDLFKVKSNGIIENKSLILNSNGKQIVFSNPCPQ